MVKVIKLGSREMLVVGVDMIPVDTIKSITASNKENLVINTDSYILNVFGELRKELEKFLFHPEWDDHLGSN